MIKIQEYLQILRKKNVLGLLIWILFNPQIITKFSGELSVDTYNFPMKGLNFLAKVWCFMILMICFYSFKMKIK